ncbi:aspartate--tRNA(Asn) ligase, partial [Candidatus Micrarchaeota archaeon CG11_big_fil_rev_8_21_14_0_20_47_5]
KVFMSVPVFRAEKHNTTSHLNEVLQMDVEIGFADHIDAMDMLEKVVLQILNEVKKENEKELKLLNCALPTPEKIPRHTYSQLVELLQKNNHSFEWGSDFSREDEAKIFSLLGEELYFIYEWPTAIRAFYSMPSSANPKICNAFDLCYRGMEIASGAQRIHAPEIIEAQLLSRGLSAADFEFYIDAFRVGAPPHAGWSIGLERIAMCISGQKNIRECALFPRDRTRLSP